MKAKIHIEPSQDKWASICRRPSQIDETVERTVEKIIEKVRADGDKALRKFSEKFDGVKQKKFLVSADEINEAHSRIDPSLKRSIDVARRNIEAFHSSQVETVSVIETMPGIRCWRESVAIEKIGIYIPGGTAPLFSTILMLVVPARIAGCKEIILCTPPGKNNKIDPAILYVASSLGVEKVYRVGGAQAIAAMAYGTETIPRVHKIFGPGNQFVTVAKQLVQKHVAIDMPAGPSEVMVIADETAVPSFIASDLLAQAEHGVDSQVVLVTNSLHIAQQVMQEMGVQIEKLPRKNIARKAVKKSHFVVLSNMEDAVEFSNAYAPEHLILCCATANEITKKIRAAGSVFIGNYSPESAGDYASGTNHTLPTNGFAAAYSGVSVDSFVKKITFQELTKEGLQNIGETVVHMAEAEGLVAHRNSITIRLAHDDRN